MSASGTELPQVLFSVSWRVTFYASFIIGDGFGGIVTFDDFNGEEWTFHMEEGWVFERLGKMRPVGRSLEGGVGVLIC
jgi:hypothetical protein